MAKFLLGDLVGVKGLTEIGLEVGLEVLKDWDLHSLAHELARKGKFEEAMKFVEMIEDAGWQSKALAEIATEMAKAVMKEEAQEVLQKAWHAAQETANFYRLWEVAETVAKAGFTQKTVEFAKQIVGDRTDSLPKVLYALTERGEREGLKALLPLCGWDVETAYCACKCLIRLYPDHALPIAEVVQAMVR